MNPIIDKVEATIRRHDMFSGAVLLAVSGGSDSLCMLHLVHYLRKTVFPEISLHVGHLHHGMRPEMGDADAEFVQHNCEQLKIPCTIERRSVPELAGELGIGVEDAGRVARYDFLHQLALKIGATRIATAHHADDQAETVLMRCIRGAGPRGLSGIPYIRKSAPDSEIMIVRPLLDCRRSEIERYLLELGMRGRTDSTNLARKYLRNRVRYSVLPRMKKEFGEDLPGRLCSLAACAWSLSRFSGINSREVIEHAANPRDGTIEIEAARILSFGPSMQAEIIRKLLQRAGLSGRMLTAAHYQAISAILENGGETSIPGGVRAGVSSGILRIEAGEASKAQAKPCIELLTPGRTDIPSGGAIEAEFISGGMDRLREIDPNCEAIFDADRIQGELKVRFAKPGDRMHPLGAPGSRKLQDIFIDLHIPRWRRPEIPVVTLNDVPICILGLRTSELAKVTPSTTRLLRLRHRP